MLNDFTNETKKSFIYITNILITIVIAFVITWTFFTRLLMQGFSMSPNINNRNIVFINRLYKNFFQLKRYDVIAFYINGKESIKRVIGLPGDKVKISSSNIYINDNLIDDKYLQQSLSSYTNIDIKVAENEYYVLGDNLDSSRDSRFEDIGTINRKQIIGKVWKVSKTK